MLWSNLRSSLWFVPSLIVLGALLLAAVLVGLQGTTGIDLTARWPRLFGAGAEGARGMLTAIAGSMITVAGVVFSVTIVVLSLAASQYTSRLLRNFMSSRTTQAVLGVFLGIFVYSLVVLRTIRGGDDEFVPSLAVFGAMVLAFVGIAFLVVFIHHLASMIQATHILSAVREETLAAARRLFSEAGDSGDPDGDDDLGRERMREGNEQIAIDARRTGYVQAVDVDALARVGREAGGTIVMARGVGEFAICGEPLAWVWVRAGAARPDADAVRNAWTVNHHRSVEQDPGFGIRQIVDVALKALSPAINDPMTAVHCLDQLSAVLLPLGCRRLAPVHCVEGPTLRVVVRRPGYGTLVREAFDAIRLAARHQPEVLRHLLDRCALLARHTPSAARRRVLREQVEAVARMAADDDGLPQPDRERLRAHTDAALGRFPAGAPDGDAPPSALTGT